ncbi:MAG: hypothetical protein IME96_06715 [Proteobacteria bacterium]|nr:hypothetical protein [Pseudomonadota bacterium]
MKFKVSSKDVDKFETDAVVLLFFSDEKPLKGASGLVDWRMNGSISKLLESEMVSGDKGETTLVVPQGRIKGGKIMMVGLGDSSRFKARDLENIAPVIVEKLVHIDAKKVIIAIPLKKLSSIKSGKTVSSLMKGMKKSDKEGAKLQATLIVEDEDIETVKEILKESAL